jgi:hypothetical protein
MTFRPALLPVVGPVVAAIFGHAEESLVATAR